MKYILIFGNPVDGFTYLGPFDSTEEANDYADDKIRRDDWWVAILDKPE